MNASNNTTYHLPKTLKGKLAKTNARKVMYNTIDHATFFNKTHIVIASQICGDIKWLLSRGVRKDRIIACDLDPVARANARKLGVVVSPYDSLENTIRWAIQEKYVLASVNADLCGKLGAKTTKILDEVLTLVQDLNVSVFVTFLRGMKDGMVGSEERKAFFQCYFGEFKVWHEYQTDSPMTAVAL